MTQSPPAVPPMRVAVFEALKLAAPASFNDELRHAFLAEGLNLELAVLGMDSLEMMEFCIAIELSTGVTLVHTQLEELASTDAVERYLAERLAEPAGSAG